MVKAGRKPELIVIAGSNGSGKTSVTRKFLHHEWADLPMSRTFLASGAPSILDCLSLAHLLDFARTSAKP